MRPVHQLRQDADVQSQRDFRRFDVRDRTPYLTSQQAIAFLELPSLGALYWHIKENRLPYGRVGGRYRFRQVELEAWVAGQRAVLAVAR
jgi:excisionase family DNA binding protein